MNRVLEGMRVLEWATMVQGPSAAAMLGDLGAEVIKIESKDTGDPLRHLVSMGGGIPIMGPDGVSLLFTWLNRNKKSITIDLKAPGAPDIVYRILRESDVFISNFRPTAAAKLGISYERVREVNPAIIYAEFTGYGSRGPNKDTRAMASSGLALSGILTAQRHLREGPSLGDHSHGDQMGSVCGTQGILAALLARERYGIGQKVSASLVSGALLVHQMNLAITCLTGVELKPARRTQPASALSSTYKTSDGKWISLSLNAYAEENWFMLCEALGLPRLASDRRFATRRDREANSRLLYRILQRAFRSKILEQWIQIAREYDLTAAPVRTLPEAINDPQLVANGYVVSFPHPTLGTIKSPGMPFDLSETPGSVFGPAPKLGGDTGYVLEQIAGYSPSEIGELRSLQVV